MQGTDSNGIPMDSKPLDIPSHFWTGVISVPLAQECRLFDDSKAEEVRPIDEGFIHQESTSG